MYKISTKITSLVVLDLKIMPDFMIKKIKPDYMIKYPPDYKVYTMESPN